MRPVYRMIYILALAAIVLAGAFFALKESPGVRFLAHNSWLVEEINDPDEFLATVIENVPPGYLWEAVGLIEKSVDQLVYSGLVTRTRSDSFKVRLDQDSSEELLRSIFELQIGTHCLQHFISKDDHHIMASFDYLAPGATQLSNSIPLSKLKGLVVAE